MSLVAAIVKRDLLSRMRVKRFYLSRVVFVLLVSSLVLFGFVTSSQWRVTTIGMQIFEPVVLLLALLACVVSPWNAAPVLTQEKEDRTLGLLLLSEMRPRQVVLGKLLSSTLSTVILVLSGLPLLVLCVGLGGVSTTQVLVGVAVLLAAVFLGSGLGLLASSLSSSSRAATGMVTLLGIVLYLALPLFLGYRGVATRNAFLKETLPVIVSPFAAISTITTGESYTRAAWNCLFDLLAVIPFLGVAILLLPGMAFERRKGRWSERRTVQGRPALQGNPVLWRQRLAGMNPRTMWWLCLLMVAGCAYAVSRDIGAGLILDCLTEFEIRYYFDYYEFTTDCYLLIVFLSGGIFALGVVAGCAGAFNRDKRSRAFELLMMSSLTEAELVFGKIWAPIRTCLPWLFLFCLSFLLLRLTDGVGWNTASSMIVGFLSAVFAQACTACYLSLRYKRHISMALTVIFCIPWVFLAGATSFAAAGAFVWVVMALALAYVSVGKLFHRLRLISNGEIPCV